VEHFYRESQLNFDLLIDKRRVQPYQIRLHRNNETIAISEENRIAAEARDIAIRRKISYEERARSFLVSILSLSFLSAFVGTYYLKQLWQNNNM
jgi:hypothetical protein